MSEKHRDYFNSISDKWDKRRPDNQCLLEILKRCNIRSGMRVLDVGAGTGCMSSLLVEAVESSGQVVALDVAELMLVKAATKPELKSVQFVCGCASKLPFHSGTLDALLCFAVFPHFAHPKASLTQMYQVIKPGGRICIAHLMGSKEMNRHHKEIGGVVGNDILPNRYDMKCLLNEAKFQNVSIIDQPELYLAVAVK